MRACALVRCNELNIAGTRLIASTLFRFGVCMLIAWITSTDSIKFALSAIHLSLLFCYRSVTWLLFSGHAIEHKVSCCLCQCFVLKCTFRDCLTTICTGRQQQRNDNGEAGRVIRHQNVWMTKLSVERMFRSLRRGKIPSSRNIGEIPSEREKNTDNSKTSLLNFI